jgi:hypothetical protein
MAAEVISLSDSPFSDEDFEQFGDAQVVGNLS